MIEDLEKLVKLIEKEDSLRKRINVKSLASIRDNEKEYPLYCFSIGSQNFESPTLFITGGFHGIERVGAQLAWSFLKTSIDRLLWDKSLKDLLSQVRMVIVPLVNPVGYLHHMRSNGTGVDLMRNSPVKAVEKTPFLIGGQRFSNKLPWYQGTADRWEPEAKAIVDLFESEVGKSSHLISIDFHSGFGMKDRLWFPFSYSSKPFDNLAEMTAITNLFEQAYPYHIYQIEPQSMGYLLSGDIWDYFYLEYLKKNPSGVFLPMTLEMGSWSWVKKNPLQLFSKAGAFNPIKEHRLKRTYRRHHLLFDFLLRALFSNEIWSQPDEAIRNRYHNLGLKRWYS